MTDDPDTVFPALRMQKNTCRHDPPNSFGDCFRTAVACLLERPASDVPHVFADADVSGDEGWARMDSYLAEEGFRLAGVVYDGNLLSSQQVLEAVGGQNPDAWWILGGSSRPGVGHFVVCHGPRIANDPGSSSPGLSYPTKDGHYWVVFLIRR